MIPTTSVLRIARPTDNLAAITNTYIKGLGFQILAEFQDHNGFDGTIIGHSQHSYHLEFTHHKGTNVGKAPTQDNLLVFYIEDKKIWQECCDNMLTAGFTKVTSYNPYWDVRGQTFEDLDGYRVVLQYQTWTA